MKSRLFIRIILSWVLCSLLLVSGCVSCIGYCGPTVQHERTVHLSKPMAAGSVFVATSRDGWMTVTGSDVTDCNVTATIIARANSDENAIRIAEQTTLKLEPFGRKLTVKLDKPILVGNQSVDVRLTGTVRKDCDIELVTDDGDITVDNVNGKMDIKTDDGAVTMSGVGSNIKVRSNDGPVSVRDVTGDVNVQSDDGKITVVYSEDAGRVCNVSLVTNDAPVDFTAPANFSATVEMITDDGPIQIDLPIQVQGKLGKSGMKGTIGAGEGHLYIRTDDGSIRIR